MLARPKKILAIIRNKGSVRSCHSLEKPRETRQLNVMGTPGWDPGAGKGHWVKPDQGMDFGGSVSMLVS